MHALPLFPSPLQVSTAVSDLAALIYDKAGWPELMPAITAMLTSSNQQQVGGPGRVVRAVWG